MRETPWQGPGGGGFSWLGPRQDNTQPGGGRELTAASPKETHPLALAPVALPLPPV